MEVTLRCRRSIINMGSQIDLSTQTVKPGLTRCSDGFTDAVTVTYVFLFSFAIKTKEGTSSYACHEAPYRP